METISDKIAEHGAKVGEIVDVVDEMDNVLFQTTRVDAMRQGLRYRFAQVIVCNSQGDFWVQWRSRHKKIAPRQFGLTGGVVEAGEDYVTSATRELEEEMGIGGVELKEIGRYSSDGGDVPYRAANFLVVWDGKQPTGWETEAEAVALMPRDELEDLIERCPFLFTDGLKLAFNQLKEWEKNHG